MTALLVLPDGREISSGEVGKDAILSLTLTAGVNDTQELTLGSVYASMVEAELLVPEGELGLGAGEEVTLYWVEGENREKAGIFVAEKPEKTGKGTYSLTCFDRVSRLDQDVTDWLESLDGWPYSLLDFGKLVCRHCGVELANTQIPNGDYQVKKFAARGITGRQILFWVGEAAGRFLRATPEGTLLLDWYTPAEKTVSASGEDFYYQDTLTYSDYRTAPIDRVQLRFDEKDVGTIYPPEAAGNTYAVTGNYLLTAEDAKSLLPVAEVLYGELSGVQYTPCKLTVPSRLGIREGQILTVETPTGERLTAYVMGRTASRGRDTLECTGSCTRDSSTAVTSQSYKALSGKLLRLQTNVDGLTVENQDMAGRLTAITANVEGITARVEKTETKVTAVQAAALAEAITQYYLSTSTTELAGGSWSETAPEWVDGKYMWSRTKTTKGDGSVSYSAPTCIAGATGPQGEKGESGTAGVGVQSIDVQYYLSTSATTLTGGSWSATAPTWVNGKYMWSKTVTTLSSGGVEESKPVCITGAKGSTGASGTTITAIEEEYYLSDSKTEQTGGSWVPEPPVWSAGKYLWTRSKIIYANPTKTEYTTPVCDSSWEAVNEVQVGGTNLLLDTDAPSLAKVAAEYDRSFSPSVDGVDISGVIILSEESPCQTKNIVRIDVKNEDMSQISAGIIFYNTAKENRAGINYNPGEQYTMSCYARKVSGEPQFSFAINGLAEFRWRTITEEWSQYSLTFTATDEFNTSTVAWAIFRAHTQHIGTLEMTGFKIERGNKATDWTPAPEDTRGLIVQEVKKEVNFEITEGSIFGSVSEINNRIDGIDDTLETAKKEGIFDLTAEGLSLKFTQALQNAQGVHITGTGFHFDREGLSISNEGQSMKNLLDEAGMKVTRDGTEILTATKEGVKARDLTAGQYLIVGENARFEDYGTGRSACFWVGG